MENTFALIKKTHTIGIGAYSIGDIIPVEKEGTFGNYRFTNSYGTWLVLNKNIEKLSNNLKLLEEYKEKNFSYI